MAIETFSEFEAPMCTFSYRLNTNDPTLSLCFEPIAPVPQDDEYEDYDQSGDDDDREECQACDGFGWVNCHCGGDLCICENNGEAPCMKCGGF